MDRWYLCIPPHTIDSWCCYYTKQIEPLPVYLCDTRRFFRIMYLNITMTIITNDSRNLLTCFSNGFAPFSLSVFTDWGKLYQTGPMGSHEYNILVRIKEGQTLRSTIKIYRHRHWPMRQWQGIRSLSYNTQSAAMIRIELTSNRERQSFRLFSSQLHHQYLIKAEREGVRELTSTRV